MSVREMSHRKHISIKEKCMEGKGYRTNEMRVGLSELRVEPKAVSNCTYNNNILEF